MNKSEIKKLVNKLLDKPSFAFQKFHLKTKIKRFAPSLPTQRMPKAWLEISYKSYPRLPTIILPPPEEISLSFSQVLQQRTSERVFGTRPISIEKLSTLLYYTSGVQQTRKEHRFYASGGARYPIETYCVLQNTDLQNNLYHYNVKHHTLELLLTNPQLDRSLNVPWLSQVGCILLFSAMFDRTTMKYGDRGYRLVLHDAGAITQNAYLVSTALDLNVCALGGYKDDALNTLLDIDGMHESMIGVVCCGEKPA